MGVVIVMKVQIETYINRLPVVGTAEFIRCDPDYLPGEDYLEDVVIRWESGHKFFKDTLTATSMKEVEDLLLDEGRQRSKDD